MLEKAVATAGLIITVVCMWVCFWFRADWSKVGMFIGLAVQLFGMYYMDD